MTKTLLFALISLLLLNSCTLTNYLSDDQMKKVAESNFYLDQSDKDASVFVGIVRKSDSSNHAGRYILTIENPDGSIIKQEYFDSDFFNYGVAYLHLWKDERNFKSDSARVRITQSFHKQGKQWAVEHLNQEIAARR